MVWSRIVYHTTQPIWKVVICVNDGTKYQEESLPELCFILRKLNHGIHDPFFTSPPLPVLLFPPSTLPDYDLFINFTTPIYKPRRAIETPHGRELPYSI